MNLLMQKKKVVKSAIISGVFLGVALAIMLSSLLFNESLSHESQNNTTELQQIESQTHALQEKIQKSKQFYSLYQVINEKNKNGALTLSRAYAREVLQAYSDALKINSITIKISPITEMKSITTLQDTSSSGGSPSAPVSAGEAEMQPIYSTVEITMQALTDEVIFAFCNAVKYNFSGYVRVQKMEVNKLQGVASAPGKQTDLQPQVEGRFIFHWLGMQKKSDLLNTNAPQGQATSKPI